jgi:REP element-mobilizing transposase RayT
MPRIARIKVKGEAAVYHVISRTALDGFVLGDVEKDYLVKIIRHLCSIYFAEVLGFCAMGNHLHLLLKMHPGTEYSDDEIRKRFKRYYGDDQTRKLLKGQIPHFREKWADLSEYVKEIKQRFSRYYNRLHNRRGYFWSDRFKSVLVDNGETLINCLAYIDLNPVRAGIVKKPENYRWCSLGYHVQRKNEDDFLSLDFGLAVFGVKDNRERLKYYRRFVYEKGSLRGQKREEQKDFEIGAVDRFKYRTRYFTDSGVIGTKAFVERIYQQFKHHFTSKNEKRPRVIKGLDGVYSLKRLSESL